MTGLNNEVDVLKKQYDTLMNKLSPDQQRMALASIKEMDKGTTQEDVIRIQDKEIQKLRDREAKEL